MKDFVQRCQKSAKGSQQTGTETTEDTGREEVLERRHCLVWRGLIQDDHGGMII